jgi:hypothetical protein
MKEALQEKEPSWQIYCYMGEDDLSRREFWSEMIERQFDAAAGDETDRWNCLLDQFSIEQEMDVLEEYDGMNADKAKFLVM